MYTFTIYYLVLKYCSVTEHLKIKTSIYVMYNLLIKTS